MCEKGIRNFEKRYTHPQPVIHSVTIHGIFISGYHA